MNESIDSFTQLSEKPSKIVFGEQKNLRLSKIVSWCIFLLGILGTFLIMGNDGQLFPHLVLNIAFTVFIIIISFGSLTAILFVFNKKFYNTFLYLLLFVILGFVFKRLHLPGSSLLMLLGFGISSSGFIILALFSWFTITNNKFLRLFGLFINIILAVTFLGGLFKTQHWLGANYLISIGTLLFFISIFSLVFTLPNSNYINWTAFHKKFFYRAILFPMLLIFITSTLTFAFPKTWDNLMYGNNKADQYWGMKKIELLEKEGLNKQ